MSCTSLLWADAHPDQLLQAPGHQQLHQAQPQAEHPQARGRFAEVHLAQAAGSPSMKRPPARIIPSAIPPRSQVVIIL